MRNIALRFASAFLCLAAFAHAAAADFRTDSLATLCAVWSEVKFHDPRLFLGEVDWDGALVRAIPKVREAQTSDQLAHEIGAMLAELGDPVTRVARQSEPRAAAPVPLLRWDGDVLIVNIGPYRDSVTDEGLFFGLFSEEITAELPKAKSVVVDFRTQSVAPPPLNFDDLGMILEQLTLVSEQVAVPPRRRVFHSGYVPGPTPGNSYSAVQVIPSPPLWGSGEKGGLPARYVFIVGGELPDQAAALWWSGHAAIVADAPVLDDRIARTRRIDLGGGWFAAVRVSETIAQGISADTVVEPGGQGDAAMTKALALARDPAPLPARPAPRLTATVPIATSDAAYADMSYPDLPYRLLGLFRLWSVVDRFYPFKDRLGDWRAVLAESIPRFEAASNAEDYSRAVLEVLALLHDGHTQAFGPIAMWNVIGARILPLELRSIEGRFVVTGMEEELPRDSPIAIGDEIVSIDGEPLQERVRRLWKYSGASNEAARADRVLFHAGRGTWDSVAELGVRGADGATRTVKVARTRSRNIAGKGEIWHVLDGNIGYVDLTRLTVPQIDAMFTALSGTDAIVFDMRGEPHETGWSIAPRINTKRAAVGAIVQRPQLVPSKEFETLTSYSFAMALPKMDRAIYSGRTVMLIDERAISEAEWTGLLFEAANGTKFIGSNSAGAVGDPAYLDLPGGITARFTGHDVRHADGRPVQGIGLVPDVRVEPTVAGIRAGRDEVLERALAYLRSVN